MIYRGLQIPTEYAKILNDLSETDRAAILRIAHGCCKNQRGMSLGGALELMMKAGAVLDRTLTRIEKMHQAQQAQGA